MKLQREEKNCGDGETSASDEITQLIENTNAPQQQQGTMTLNFRPLQEGDRDQIKILHEELFPVQYSDDFYNNAVQNKTFTGTPILSRIAVVEGDEEEKYFLGQNKSEPLDELARFVGIRSFEKDGINDAMIIPRIKCEKYGIVCCIIGVFSSNSEPYEKEKGVFTSLIRDPTQHTRTFYIMTLGASVPFRKQRLGTKLFTDLLKIVEQVPSCGAIYLHVITYNTAAIKFYENLGFYRIAEMKGR